MEAADGVLFIPCFANAVAFATGEGLVMVDTGSPVTADAVHAAVRRFRPDRLDTAVHAHGHVDHVFGTAAFEGEAAANGWAPPTVVAHRGVPERFDRYRLTAGYNGTVDQRQFQLPSARWPTDHRYPDRTYDDAMVLDRGGLRVG